MGKAKSYRERVEALERFQKGCREAMNLLSQPGHKTDAEHNELADRLGPHLPRRELQDDLPMGAA